jgi:hypothetical protein
MLDPDQFAREIVEPTLHDLGMTSPAAIRLMVGTAIAESGLTWLRQHNGGPAVGLFQIEPATARDILDRYLARRTDLNMRLCASFRLLDDTPPIDWHRVSDLDLEDALVGDARFSCAVARIRYFMSPKRLPAADDDAGLGLYWKEIYNTAAGKGRPEKFARLLAKHYPWRG